MLIVNQLFNDGTFGVGPQLQFPELHIQGVVQQQATIQGRALAQDDFDGFRGLDYANDPRQNSQHTPFGAGGNHARRRGFGIEVAVVGAAFVVKDGGLALKPEDGTVNVGLVEQNASVVHQVAGGEVVRSVYHDVVGAEDVEGVFRTEPRLVQIHLAVGVNFEDPIFGGFDFGFANPGCAVDDLALQVGVVHHVKVHQANPANAGGGEVEQQGRTQTAAANAEHAGGFQTLLAFQSHFGQDEVSRVAFVLFF